MESVGRVIGDGADHPWRRSRGLGASSIEAACAVGISSVAPADARVTVLSAVSHERRTTRPSDAGGVEGADGLAEVERVLDAIEDHEQ